MASIKQKRERNISEENTRQPDMTASLDLEAYFRRIGYTGERMPTLNTLSAIQALHPQAIAFENLNPFLRLPVHLDIGSIQQKLVRGGRGGYCFEQNLLLSHVLQVLGFKVKGLAARILWNVPEGVVTARGHMLLLVEISDQSFIADVGFGGLTLTAPLRLEPGIVQETPHEAFRLIRMGETFIMQAMIRSEWKPLYQFELQEQLLPDYEVTNWYLSNHPNSHFVNGLIAARVSPDRRYALRNKELAVHHLNGSTDRHTLSSISALRSTLEENFGLNLSELSGIDTALQRLI